MERRGSLRAVRAAPANSSGPSTRPQRSSRLSTSNSAISASGSISGSSRVPRAAGSSDEPVEIFSDADLESVRSDSLSELSSPEKRKSIPKKGSGIAAAVVDRKGKGKAITDYFGRSVPLRAAASSLGDGGLEVAESPLTPDTRSELASPAAVAPEGEASSSTAAPVIPPIPPGRGSTGRKGRLKPSNGSTGNGPVGQAKQPERRVLPARIRRAAGGGAEGIRELEEMIVDWLERYGEPQESPPPDLPILITSLPLSLVDPPVTTFADDGMTESLRPAITLTPTRTQPAVTEPSTSAAAAVLAQPRAEKIEVPTWRMVRAGEDDAEEAREEMLAGRGRGRMVPRSPVKRLRGALSSDQALEDVSDAHYIALHKKYEVFERRQRIREKEKLQFERYKMRSRVELLRNMADIPWITVVNTVLARYGPGGSGSGSGSGSGNDAEGADGAGPWSRGREKVMAAGAGWLRSRLVKEGEEVLKRYDQLLPPEHRKKGGVAAAENSRLSTPTPSMPSPSVSPPPPIAPAVLPARVSALRDPVGSAPRKRAAAAKAAVPPKEQPSPASVRKRRRAAAAAAAVARDDDDEGPDEEDGEDDYDGGSDVVTPLKPSRATRASKRRKASPDPVVEPQADVGRTLVGATPSEALSPITRLNSPIPTHEPCEAPAPSSFALHNEMPSQPDGDSASDIDDDESKPAHDDTDMAEDPAPEAGPSQIPAPPTLGQPYLLEAASRREHAIEETLSSQARVAQGRTNRLIAREKTRISRRLEVTTPFGMPFPVNVEWKSEFTLMDLEEFWGVIAAREAGRDRARRESMGLPPVQTAVSGALLQEPEPQASTSKSPPMDGDVPPVQPPALLVPVSTPLQEDVLEGPDMDVEVVVSETTLSADEAREMREVEAAVVI